MAWRYQISLLAFLVLASLFPSFDAASAERVCQTDDLGEGSVKEWSPIKYPNEHRYVVNLAKFAVTKHNEKAGTRLVLKEVLSGDIRVSDCFQYKLEISTQEYKGHGAKHFIVFLTVDPWNHVKRLIYFTDNMVSNPPRRVPRDPNAPRRAPRDPIHNY